MSALVCNLFAQTVTNFKAKYSTRHQVCTPNSVAVSVQPTTFHVRPRLGAQQSFCRALTCLESIKPKLKYQGPPAVLRAAPLRCGATVVDSRILRSPVLRAQATIGCETYTTG